MKKHLVFFLFFLLSTLSVFAGVGEDIIRLVQQNELPVVAIGLALLFFIALLIYRVRKKKKKRAKETVTAPPLSSQPLPSPEPEPETITQPEELLAPQPEVEIVLPPTQVVPVLLPPVIDPAEERRKEHAFESYVVERFSPEYFKLLEWRSDKYHEGRYAGSNKLPDLEYHFTTSEHDFPIAIECKWRADFFKGRIEWARSYQLKNYREYETGRGIPVYVIIGIGGEPSAPAAVYLVPLQHIRSNVLSERELYHYFRPARGAFFLDGDTMRLT